MRQEKRSILDFRIRGERTMTVYAAKNKLGVAPLLFW